MKKLPLSSLVSAGLFLFIFVLAAFLRLYSFQTTSLEVDEASNWWLAKSIYETLVPSLKPELHQAAQTFLYNPPAGYFLMAGWFELTGPSIESARVFNILVSLVMLVLIYFFLLHWGYETALLGTLFVALDGWIVQINRMNYLENIQMILIVLGMWLFLKAHQTGTFRLYALSGLMLGLAIIFKHIGVFVILVVIANFLLVRKNVKGYVMLLGTLAAVVLLYLLLMFIVFGQLYFMEQLIQFERFIGIVPSPGQNIGFFDAISVIVAKYWIFVTTIATLILGGVFVVWQNAYRFVKKIPGGDDAVLLSWAIGGLIFAAICRLTTPHYMILWLVPLYLYLAVFITKWAHGRKKLVVPALLVIFTLVSLFTWNYRFIQSRGDALRDAANYMNKTLPANAIVVTDPFLAVLMKQPYMRIDVNQSPITLANADYFAIYSSSEETDSRFSPSIRQAIKSCTQIAVFAGFKDKVVICKAGVQSIQDGPTEGRIASISTDVSTSLGRPGSGQPYLELLGPRSAAIWKPS